jgi:hypothetical protein
MLPPFWSIPFVSPPPTAVLWRPLAALPAEAGRWAWWTANAAALVGALWMLWRRRPGLVAIAVLVLFVPTAYELAFGNMHGFLLLATVMTWRSWLAGKDVTSGVIAGVAIAAKLVPATLAWWLLVTGRRTAVAAVIATVGAIGLVSLAGAGVDAHVEYVRLLLGGKAIGIYGLSLGGLALGAGVDPSIARALPTVGALVGLVGVFALRAKPHAAFTLAVVAMVVGSPAVNLPWFVLLYGTLAPVAWPVDSTEQLPGVRPHAGPPLAPTQRTGVAG